MVTYPLAVLREDVDVVVSQAGSRAGQPALCYERGRILRADAALWR